MCSWKCWSHVLRVSQREPGSSRNKERSWLRRPAQHACPLPARPELRILNSGKSPLEKNTQRCTQEAGSCCCCKENPGDFSSCKLVESKNAFSRDAKSCFSSLPELPLVQALPSTYTSHSSTCGWCSASSRTLRAAFIGGKPRPVSVATQILAASPRFPPPRSRPQTRREKHLKGAGDSWVDG